MKKMSEQKIKTITARTIDIATGITLISGLFDLWLWFREQALIPSWTMTVAAVCGVILMQLIRRKL